MMICITAVIFLINGAIFQRFEIFPYNMFKTHYIVREKNKEDEKVREQVFTSENAMLLMNLLTDSDAFECITLGDQSKFIPRVK